MEYVTTKEALYKLQEIGFQINEIKKQHYVKTVPIEAYEELLEASIAYLRMLDDIIEIMEEANKNMGGEKNVT